MKQSSEDEKLPYLWPGAAAPPSREMLNGCVVGIDLVCAALLRIEVSEFKCFLLLVSFRWSSTATEFDLLDPLQIVHGKIDDEGACSVHCSLSDGMHAWFQL